MADIAVLRPPQARAEEDRADAILRVDAVDKRFLANGGEIEALRGVNLVIGRGEFVCLDRALGLRQVHAAADDRRL